MSTINHALREIHCKVVYYGPGLSGKTANVEHIFERTLPEARGQMISLKTESERTLFFDFLPLSLGEVAGFRTRFHLYTVPGQVFYDATRKLILRGADAVIFVADSQPTRIDANSESWENLLEHLEEWKMPVTAVPIVFQYNKRDLPDAVPIEELRARLNTVKAPEYEAVAVRGRGVFETFKGAAKSVFSRLRERSPRSVHVAKAGG